MIPDQTPANTLTEPARDNTPEERRRAALVIADRCPDHADALQLLRMLGLDRKEN